MKRSVYAIISAVVLQFLILHPVWAEETTPVREILDNGMTVILQENHRSPVVIIQAWVGAGSITEGEYLGSGISHFAEHMLFKGTERRSVGQIGEEVKEAGGSTNAYTGNDKTVYHITFHSDHFDKALDIMADVVMNSVFDPEEVEKERAVIIKEIKMNRDDPFRRLYLKANETAFAVHPYRHPVIGYENLLRALTREDLLTYYRRMYVPNNMMFIAVGDFDASEALPKIREAFRGFERKSIAPTLAPVEPLQRGRRERVEEFDVAVAQTMMGFHGPNLHSPDLYPMDVLAIVLGGGETSRLYKELREERGIVYSISAWSATPRDPGMFWILSTYEPENHVAVEKGIWEQIEIIRSDGISEKELETARAKVLSGYIFAKETVKGQARSMGSDEFDAHDLHFGKNYIDSIGRVTSDEIVKVLDKYFRPENVAITTLVPRGKKTVSEGQASPEEGPADAAEIKKYALANGITVLLREDHSAETVAIKLHVLGGARSETEANTGITSLMSEVMLKGTSTRSAEDIAWAIESRGGGISAFSGYNSFGFNVNMLSRDIEVGLDILADIVANPSFSEEEVERERTAALAKIKKIEDDIFSSSMKLFRETMFEGHPYSFHSKGNVKVVQALTAEKLKEFHSRASDSSRMVLSVFGDIDKTEVEEIIERNFSQLKKGGELKFAGPPDTAANEPKKASKVMNKEQLAIIVGFPGIDVAHPDRYTTNILSNFLNSQGGKLFQTLRDERGLAYSVGAFNILGIDPGAFVLYIFTEPNKREEATAGIFEVVEELRENGITAKELQRTKTEVMGHHAIRTQTNGELATEVAFDELYGLGYANHKQHDAMVRSVTEEDIRRVALELFDLDSYTIVTVGNVESAQ
jgi:zinc protease